MPWCLHFKNKVYAHQCPFGVIRILMHVLERGFYQMGIGRSLRRLNCASWAPLIMSVEQWFWWTSQTHQIREAKSGLGTPRPIKWESLLLGLEHQSFKSFLVKVPPRLKDTTRRPGRNVNPKAALKAREGAAPSLKWENEISSFPFELKTHVSGPYCLGSHSAGRVAFNRRERRQTAIKSGPLPPCL